MDSTNIAYRLNPGLTNAQLNDLFAAAWAGHSSTNFQTVLARSLVYVGAFDGPRLAGFVNVAWDGGIHAFLLDTTVHPQYQRRGIGRQLVLTAIQAAKERGMHWLHVDYEPHLEAFYHSCGFTPTLAGLLRLNG